MASQRLLLASFWSGVLCVSAALGQGGSAPSMPQNAPLFSTGTGSVNSLSNASNAPALPSYVPSTTQSSTSVLTSTPNAVPPAANYNVSNCGGNSCGTPCVNNCCGPIGGNGPITYELYVNTGPNILIGGGNALRGAMNTVGWDVAGGGRTLFFNVEHDAAWVVDLGIGYIYNRGNNTSVINVEAPVKFVANNSGITLGQVIPTTAGSMYRTTFNYSFGRDWYLNGPATTLTESCWNSRVGLDVGGRWGTAHINLYSPLAGVTNDYARIHSVTESVTLGAHWDWERNMGNWILFGGMRFEIANTWTNLVGPQSGLVQDINLLMTMGVRF